VWTARSGLFVTLAGAIAGAVVALLCGLGIVIDFSDYLEWHIIPAGAAQGAVVAGLGWLFGGWGWSRSPGVRVASALLAGWAGGVLASLPVAASLSGGWLDVELDAGLALLRVPFQALGTTSALYSLWVSSSRPGRPRWAHLAAATMAGVAGYELFWLTLAGSFDWDAVVALGALLHGSVWGVAVGLATASALDRRPTRVAGRR
jgi:hypothetical protein